MAEQHPGEQFKQSDEAPESPLPLEQPRTGTEKLSHLIHRAMQDTEKAYQTAEMQDSQAASKPEQDMLQRAVEAAQKNNVTEVQLERRHEVKDDPSGASTLPSVTAAPATDTSPGLQPISSKSSAPGVPTHAPLTPSIWQGFLRNNSLYGQAIRYGIICALMSLLCAIIFVLLI